MKTITSLIKTNEDVTPDAGREVDLSLEVELDTDGQRRGLEVAVVVDGTLEEVTCVNSVSQLSLEKNS